MFYQAIAELSLKCLLYLILFYFYCMPEEKISLNKYISATGYCSRREADEWISRGWVRVDGKVISELGTKILPNQRITIDEANQ